MTNQALIFFDIDGTLLDHDKNLPSTTKSAINQLQSDGHIIAIATGRGPFMYEGLRQELNIDTFISFNGSYVVLEDKVIYTHPLNKQKLLELTQEGLVNDQPSVYMSENELRSNVEHHDFVEESIATLKLDVTAKFDPDYALNRDIYQVLFYINEDETTYYQENYSEFEFVRWHPLSVDVVPQGGSKAKGIHLLVDELNIRPENVYAFGDGLNDVEMLQSVKNSVAMGNGVPEAKAAAKYTTKDVDQDGLVEGLKMTGLL